MNTGNVDNFGPRADLRLALETEPVALIMGTLTAGAVYAAIITVIAGFFF
jgi:hypothetical protein